MDNWNDDGFVQGAVWKERAWDMRAEYQRLRERVQEATTLLAFEANLGPPEHQATVREVVRHLTAAIETGAMSRGTE